MNFSNNLSALGNSEVISSERFNWRACVARCPLTLRCSPNGCRVFSTKGVFVQSLVGSDFVLGTRELSHNERKRILKREGTVLISAEFIKQLPMIIANEQIDR